VLQEKRLRGFLAELRTDNFTRSTELQGSRSRVVRVTRNNVNEALCNPGERVTLRTGSEHSQQGASGNLCVTANAHPTKQALRSRPQDSVAFGMRDDGPQASKLKLMQCLIHCGRN